MDVQAIGECCAPLTGGFLRYFQEVCDPRGHNAIHQFTDILVLAFCAVLCGAEGWVDVEEFAKSKFTWFKTFLELPAGIPSHDTFGRVFAALDPDEFERCFTVWMAVVAERRSELDHA